MAVMRLAVERSAKDLPCPDACCMPRTTALVPKHRPSEVLARPTMGDLTSSGSMSSSLSGPRPKTGIVEEPNRPPLDLSGNTSDPGRCSRVATSLVSGRTNQPMRVDSLWSKPATWSGGVRVNAQPRRFRAPHGQPAQSGSDPELVRPEGRGMESTPHRT
jgi:hypothetical protein